MVPRRPRPELLLAILVALTLVSTIVVPGGIRATPVPALTPSPPPRAAHLLSLGTPAAGASGPATYLPSSGSGSGGPVDPVTSAMAYDPAAGAIIAVDANLTGNSTASLRWSTPGLTWSYSGGAWSLLPLTTAPPPLIWASMAYDARDGYLLLFGGMDLAQGNSPQNPWATVNYTWAYANGSWTNLSAGLAQAPPPSVETQMVYDAADGAILLLDTAFGWGPEYTWTFSNGSWTNVTGVESGSLPKYGGLGYDAADGSVLYFGGQRPPNPSQGGAGRLMNTTWAYRNGSWQNLTASVTGAPTPRAQAALTYDAPMGSLLLFGGAITSPTGTAAYLNDSWTYSNGTWRTAPMSGAPSPRGGAHLIEDPTDGAVVCAGGFGSVANVATNGSIVEVYADLADTWAAAGGNWSLQAPSIAPARPVIDAGMRLSLEVQGPAAGPAGHLVFVDLPTGCSSQSVTTLSCVPTSTGTFRPSAEIVTSAGSIGWASTLLAINPAPVLRSFAASSSQVTVGHSVALSAVAALGTGGLSYTYTGLPPGCPPDDTPDLTCRPSGAGTFVIHLQVTDSVGGSASGSVVLTVAPGPFPLPAPPGHGPRGPGGLAGGPLGGASGSPFVAGVLVGLAALLAVGAWAGGRARTLWEGAKLTRALDAPSESVGGVPRPPAGGARTDPSRGRPPPGG